MQNKFIKYGQYKNDFFSKLNLDLKPGEYLLDIGCGKGEDAKIFACEYGLNVSAIDVYQHEDIDSIKQIKFSIGSIYKIPYPDSTFDIVFLHDVLHHIDEEHQDYKNHLLGLKEVKRVLKKGGRIYIVESNRFNLISYFHMVRMLGHNHWRQSYFYSVIQEAFKENEINFSNFEAHAYPSCIWFWKIYERVVERFLPKFLHSYNVAVIRT